MTPLSPTACYQHGKDNWRASCDTCTTWHTHQNRLAAAETARAKRIAPYLDQIRQVALTAAWQAVAAGDLTHPDLTVTDLTSLLTQVTGQVDALARDVSALAYDVDALPDTATPAAATVTVTVGLPDAPAYIPNYDASTLPPALAALLPAALTPAARTALPAGSSTRDGERPALRVLDGGSTSSVA